VHICGYGLDWCSGIFTLILALFFSATKQVRIQTEAAKASGRKSVLVTGEHTKVSKEAAERYNDIKRRLDLGPKQE